MSIVIPMAGLSSRFTREGFDKPKFMLPLGNSTVFTHAIGSFSRYFSSEPFLFITLSHAEVEEFIRREARAAGVENFRVIVLAQPTAGQAETVEVGVQMGQLDEDEALTIFNIDTFRPDFSFPDGEWFNGSDGYLEVFRGEGSNWSFVEALEGAAEPRICRTSEKDPISDLCCTGLYHFARASDFLLALEEERSSPRMPELYVAPIYNHLIRHGRCIHYEEIPGDQVLFCGVPSEYRALLSAMGTAL